MFLDFNLIQISNFLLSMEIGNYDTKTNQLVLTSKQLNLVCLKMIIRQHTIFLACCFFIVSFNGHWPVKKQLQGSNYGGGQQNKKVDSELALRVFQFPMLHWIQNKKISSEDPWEVLPVEWSISGKKQTKIQRKWP